MDKPNGQNALVRVANERLRAIWHAESVWQGRLLALMASQISHTDRDFKEYTVRLRDVMGPTRSVSISKKEEIVECLKKLLRTQITISHDAGRIVEIMSMLSYVRIDFENQVVHASFDPHLKPFYVELKTKYTTYRLDDYMSLKSTYSQKLFEYFMSWKDRDLVLVELDELHKLLDVPPSARRDFSLFRARILDKGLKEIREKTALTVSYDTVAYGRKVVGLKFYMNGRQTSVPSSEDKKRVIRKNNNLFMEAFRCAQKHVNVECEKNESAKCKLCTKLKMKDRTSCNTQRT